MPRITPSQVAGLTLLSEAANGADWIMMFRAGAKGPTLAWLVDHHLATVCEQKSNGVRKVWRITDAGRTALATGRI